MLSVDARHRPHLKGSGRMTVFNAGPSAVTADFRPGDIGYVKKGLGHYVLSTGTDDLVFVAVFRTDRYEEVALADWLTHLAGAGGGDSQPGPGGGG